MRVEILHRSYEIEECSVGVVERGIFETGAVFEKGFHLLPFLWDKLASENVRENFQIGVMIFRFEGGCVELLLRSAMEAASMERH